MSSRPRILVAPASWHRERQPLFDLLAATFGVEFRGGALESAEAADGVIAWEPTPTELGGLAARGMDALAYPSAALQPKDPQEPVVFSAVTILDRSLRRARMHDRSVTSFRALAPARMDETLGTIHLLPWWLARPVARGRIDLVGLEPPSVGAGETFYHHFNRYNWLRLLPLVAFLRRFVASDGWAEPPLRACLMFDDPNLHWRTYGFVDYAAVAAHAAERGYHAAFAVIPADLWLAHGPTAALFRDHPRQLSLTVHGNDHDGPELLRSTSAEHRRRMLAQAARRVARFERAAGIPVARVMTPPHGGFDQGGTTALLQLDFEALCVSRASLLAANPTAPWRAAFGHAIAELLPPGLPVLPRHPLGVDCTDAYRLAAFLGQPVIPHGHHHDCADSLVRIEQVVAEIGGMGDVQWCDLRTLARGNYATRRDGEVLHVRLLARRATLPNLPATIRRLVVHRPWVEGQEMLLCCQGGVLRHTGLDPAVGPEIAVQPGRTTELRSVFPQMLDPHAVRPPPVRLWPSVRRVMAEGRDRVTPFLRRPLHPRP